VTLQETDESLKTDLALLKNKNLGLQQDNKAIMERWKEAEERRQLAEGELANVRQDLAAQDD